MGSFRHSDDWIENLSSSIEDNDERKRRFSTLAAEGKPLPYYEAKNPDSLYWSVFGYNDIVEIAVNDDKFSSKSGVILSQVANELSEKQQKIIPFNGSILTLDDPEHLELRNLVSAAFTPKSIRNLQDTIERVVDEVATDFISQLRTDVMDVRIDFANRIPALVICEMLGIPAEDQPWISQMVASMMGEAHPAHRHGDSMQWFRQTRKMHKYGLRLAQSKLESPADDLMSVLLHPQDGQRPLTLNEIVDFFMLLVVSGVETTSISVSVAFHYLQQHPDQLDDLRNDFDGLVDGAIEELVRHHTPVLHFMRTAIDDVEVSGQTIRAGDRVCLWYQAGNTDPNFYDDPLSFNIRRPLKPKHLGFGPPSSHYCLGANLARAEMRAALRAIVDRMPEYELLYDQSTYCRSKWGNGWVSLPSKMK